MLTRLPAATIRTQVELPLRFADGYATDARVFSFDGLVDDREHLAFALGDTIQVIYRGKLSGTMTPEEAAEQAPRLMAGL